MHSLGKIVVFPIQETLTRMDVSLTETSRKAICYLDDLEQIGLAASWWASILHKFEADSTRTYLYGYSQ